MGRDFRWSWSKDQRDRAERTGERLYAISTDIDGERFEQSGMMTEARVRRLNAFIMELYLEQREERAAAKLEQA